MVLQKKMVLEPGQRFTLRQSITIGYGVVGELLPDLRYEETHWGKPKGYALVQAKMAAAKKEAPGAEGAAKKEGGAAKSAAAKDGAPKKTQAKPAGAGKPTEKKPA